MLISLPLLTIGMDVSLILCAGQVVAGQDEPTVVAEVGGQKITLAEVEQKESGLLLQARYKYYLAQRDALNQVIDDRLLEIQARRENISVDELLKKHVVAQYQQPTEDQIRFYYEGLDTTQSYDAVRDKILDTVHQLRLKKARAAYVESLRNELGVVIELRQPTSEVAIGDDPRKGPENAPVQIVEFADFQCPYCQKVYPVVRKLQEDFGGKVALVFKDFPLVNHASAEKAAEAARCAGVQGKYWEFHNSLFETKQLDSAQLKEQARTLKLDATQFDQCLDSGVQASLVQKDVAEGQRLGLSGTPSFFVNGHYFSGAVVYEKLREAVEQELATSPQPKQAASLSTESKTTHE